MTRWLLLVVLSTTVLAGCGSRAESAAIAVGRVQGAFEAVRFEALRYVPEQEPPVAAAVAALTASLVQERYAQVEKDAPELMTRIATLGQAVVARKTVLADVWNAVSRGVPETLDVAEAQVEAFATSKTLPRGVTADVLSDANARLDQARDEWGRANAAFRRGNLIDAVSGAEAARTRVSELLTSLGIETPDRVPSP